MSLPTTKPLPKASKLQYTAAGREVHAPRGMSVGKIFSKWGYSRFFQEVTKSNFLGGANHGEITICQLKTNRKAFF